MLALRERQAQAVREAILAALIERVERGDAEELSMDELAQAAGASRRTLYRYFPSRDALFAAAGDWLHGDLVGAAPEIESADDIAASFRAASKRLERRPALARSLMDGRIGRRVRSESRQRRATSIRRAVERAAPGLSPADLGRMSAVLAYLCSANAWLTMGEESGLSGDDARAAVTWAIETLLSDLRARAAS